MSLTSEQARLLCATSKSGLRGADLRGADLSDLDLSGQDFTRANLRETKLHGVLIDDKTVLTEADLTESEWYGATARLKSSGSRTADGDFVPGGELKHGIEKIVMLSGAKGIDKARLDRRHEEHARDLAAAANLRKLHASGELEKLSAEVNKGKKLVPVEKAQQPAAAKPAEPAKLHGMVNRF